MHGAKFLEALDQLLLKIYGTFWRVFGGRITFQFIKVFLAVSAYSKVPWKRKVFGKTCPTVLHSFDMWRVWSYWLEWSGEECLTTWKCSPWSTIHFSRKWRKAQAWVIIEILSKLLFAASLIPPDTHNSKTNVWHDRALSREGKIKEAHNETAWEMQSSLMSTCSCMHEYT